MAKRSEKRRMRVSAKKRAETHRSGFVSKTLDIPGDVEKFVLKSGTKRIDIIPYQVKVDDNPESEKGELYYERTYFVHNGVGPNNDRMVCPNRTAGMRCPVCEYRAGRAKDPKADEQEIRDLAPKERQLFNVIDVEDREKGVQVWDFSYHMFGKLLDSEVRTADDDEEHEFFPDLGDGFTLKLSVEEKSFSGRSFCEVKSIGFKKRVQQYDDSILEEVHDLDSLIIVPSYDELKKIFLQTDDEDEAGVEVAEEDQVTAKTEKSVEKKKDELEEGDLLIHEEKGVVELVMFSPDGSKAKVKDDDGTIHVVEVDNLRRRPDNLCKACQGWGKNTKGRQCSACKGSGVSKIEEEVKSDDDDWGTEDNSSEKDDDWGSESKEEASGSSDFDDWD